MLFYVFLVKFQALSQLRTKVEQISLHAQFRIHRKELHFYLQRLFFQSENESLKYFDLCYKQT